MDEVLLEKCNQTLDRNQCEYNEYCSCGAGCDDGNGVSITVSQFHRKINWKSIKLWRFIIFFSIILIYYLRFVTTESSVKNESDAESSQIRFQPTYASRKMKSLDLMASHNNSSLFQNLNFLRWVVIYFIEFSMEASDNCTPPAISYFPSDGFTRSQRQHGWIVLHILVAFYGFWFLSVICGDYFVPAIEQICKNLSMQKDVAAATIMAAATSSPELFVNFVGTFVTHGDIGIGSVLGSSLFNLLAIPACCGFFVAGQLITLDWWAVARDCLMFCLADLLLIVILYDSRVMWYEALILIVVYFLYMIAMYNNDTIKRAARKIISKCRRKVFARRYTEVTEVTPLLVSVSNKQAASICLVRLEEGDTVALEHNSNPLHSNDNDFADIPWQRNGHCLCVSILRWPITAVLWLTMPDSRKHPRLKYITFLLSIVWIGLVSYILACFITYIGDTLNIPDSVMGLTILAAGMSVPEAVSSVIVTRQGHGNMGISNSVGSNTFDVLLCLGIPWFIKAYFLPTHPDELFITMSSHGIMLSPILLLTALFCLLFAFTCNRFVLDWKIGIGCGIMYLCLITIASMMELNGFNSVNLPICTH